MNRLPAPLSRLERGLAAIACVSISAVVLGGNFGIAQRYADAGAHLQVQARAPQGSHFSAVRQQAPTAQVPAGASAPCRSA